MAVAVHARLLARWGRWRPDEVQCLRDAPRLAQDARLSHAVRRRDLQRTETVDDVAVEVEIAGDVRAA